MPEDTTINPLSSEPPVSQSHHSLFDDDSHWLHSPFFWLGVLLLLGLVAPFVPVPSRTVALLGNVVVTVLDVVAAVLFAALATRNKQPLAKLLAVGVLALAAWATLEWVIGPMALEPMAKAMRAAGTKPTTTQLLAIVTHQTFTKLALLCTAVYGGGAVARLIKSPNMLGPICAMVAMIDIWGVLLGGIVSQLLERAPEVSRKAMSQLPTVGAATAEGAKYAIAPLSIGAGDYLFLGLLFGALHLHRMNWRGAVKLTAPLIVLALLGIMLTPIPHLPGLLFIGLGVALPNLKYFQYTREEKFALIYAGIFVIILTVVLYFGVMSLLDGTTDSPRRQGVHEAIKSSEHSDVSSRSMKRFSHVINYRTIRSRRD